jgi:hypothetical protein
MVFIIKTIIVFIVIKAIVVAAKHMHTAGVLVLKRERRWRRRR